MTVHVLVLCTHNSARSVLAEGMLNHWAARLGRDVRGHSAGSAPSGRVNPLGLYDLDRKIRPVGQAYRKLIADWREVLPTQSVCLRVPVFPPSQSEWASRNLAWGRPSSAPHWTPTVPASAEGQ